MGDCAGSNGNGDDEMAEACILKQLLWRTLNYTIVIQISTSKLWSGTRNRMYHHETEEELLLLMLSEM